MTRDNVRSMTNWVVMPFLDNWEMTEQAARDVLAQDLSHTKLLLINNGSDEPATRQARYWVMDHDDTVLLWNFLPALPSLAAVWNRALRFVWQAGGKQAFVVNNDVRLAGWTYTLLLDAQQITGGWFVTGVSVKEPHQLEKYVEDGFAEAVVALGTLTDARTERRRASGHALGGPDFSCFIITEECHRYFQFDEQFIPAYHEDNDYHRRLQLAGYGERIFGLNLPFLHIGSATVNRSPEALAAWGPRFEACRAYYVQKWGGLPHHELHSIPFADQIAVSSASALAASPAGQDSGASLLYLGQGRPGTYTGGPLP